MGLNLKSQALDFIGNFGPPEIMLLNQLLRTRKIVVDTGLKMGYIVKMKKTDEATLAAIAAFKGKVTRVETGASSGISDRQWYRASKGDLDLNEKVAENREERVREKFAEARYYGASQDLAHRYATGQIDCLCCGDL